MTLQIKLIEISMGGKIDYRYWKIIYEDKEHDDYFNTMHFHARLNELKSFTDKFIEENLDVYWSVTAQPLHKSPIELISDSDWIAFILSQT